MIRLALLHISCRRWRGITPWLLTERCRVHRVAIYYRRGKHGEGDTVEESLVEKGTGEGNFLMKKSTGEGNLNEEEYRQVKRIAEIAS